MPLRKMSVLFGIAALAAFAQSPAAGPAFEVASIKAAPPFSSIQAQIMTGKVHAGMSVDGAQVDIGFMSLADLIRTAYQVKPFQVSGPDWMRQERFDILAKLPEGATKDQVPEMLKALLKERFGLAAHMENKEQPVYALVVGKNGPKLKEAEAEAAKPAEAEAGNASPAPAGRGFNTGEGTVRINQDGKGMAVTGSPLGPMRMTPGANGGMRLEMSRSTMAGFADFLTPMVDRPVVDQTELKGTYQIGLELSMEEMLNMARNAARTAGVALPGPMPGGVAGGLGAPGTGAPVASDPSGSSIFNAVQELGLRLEARKAPVETIVIDHLEKTPSEN